MPLFNIAVIFPNALLLVAVYSVFISMPFCLYVKNVKIKSSMAKSLPVENLLPKNVGSIINYL